MALADTVRRLVGGEQIIDQDRIRAAADMGTDRINGYREYEDAYDGHHRTRLSARARTYLEPGSVKWTENFIETIIDSLADRINLTGFSVQDDQNASDWLTKTAWPASHGAQLQRTISTKVPMLGDGFVIVDFDQASGLPRAYWNRPHNIKATYSEDDTHQLLEISKVWASRAVSPTNPEGRLIQRLNIHYPDRVEKWYSESVGEGALWAHHLDPGEEQWPVSWVDETGDPLGINVFPFRYKPLGNQCGRSKVRGALPFQHELNKQLLDLFEVRDQQGWPQRWAAGIPSETGTLRVAIGEILKATNENAKFGQFDAAAVTPLVEDITATLTRMSAKTRTPMHDLIKGEPPSGEALKTAEGGQVKEAEACMIDWTPSYAGVARMTLRLATVFGDQDFDPDVDIVPIFDDPHTRNETDEASNALVYSELGVSNTTLLRRLGFDPEEERKLKAAEGGPVDPPPPPA